MDDKCFLDSSWKGCAHETSWGVVTTQGWTDQGMTHKHQVCKKSWSSLHKVSRWSTEGLSMYNVNIVSFLFSFSSFFLLFSFHFSSSSSSVFFLSLFSGCSKSNYLSGLNCFTISKNIFFLRKNHVVEPSWGSVFISFFILRDSSVSWRATHSLVFCGCWPGPTRVIPPPRQGGGGTRAPNLTLVVTLGGVVVHVVVSVAGGFVVKCCLASAHLPILLFFLQNVFLRFSSFFLDFVPLPAFVLGFNNRCFLRSRCSMEMWCLDDIGRSSWD